MHTNHDGDQLYTSIVAVPLHVFEDFEVGLVKAHELGARGLGVQSHNGGGVLNRDGLLALHRGRACWKGTTFFMVAKHASEAV